MDGRPRLLLLHGFLSTSATWRPLSDALRPDAECLAVDLPGYGASPAPSGAYTLDTVVALLSRLVERERPPFVIGHSMGAIVALALSAAMPGAFERVGVVGLPVFRDRAEGQALMRRSRGLIARTFLQYDAPAHAACVALDHSRPLWLPVARAILPLEPPAVIATKFDHTRASHAGGLDGIVFAGRVPGIAASVGTPVAAFHGARDRTAPINRARDLATTHGWDFTVARTSTHQVVVEEPALAAAWVRERLLNDPAASERAAG